jgi:hypothetical protein
MLARTPDSFGPLDKGLEPGVEKGQVSGNLIILIQNKVPTFKLILLAKLLTVID